MNWITGFTIFLLIAGAIFGLFAAGTDIINPTTSQAEAQRMDAETRHLEAMNQFEEQRAAAETEAEIAAIRHQQELEEARYEAELARIAADQNYYEQMLNIKLNARQISLVTLVVLAGTAGIALIIVGTKFALVRIEMHSPTSPATPIAAKQATTQPTSPATPRQHSPNGYEQMRIEARQRELLDRHITLQRVHNACDPKGTSKEDYDKLPLAQ